MIKYIILDHQLLFKIDMEHNNGLSITHLLIIIFC